MSWSQSETGGRRGGQRLLTACALIVVLCLGCGGDPEPEPTSPRENQASAALTVIVWSTEFQRPVPAQGTLTEVSTYDRVSIDTSGDAAAGHSFRGLNPGLYRVDIEHRFEPGGGQQAVQGADEIYLEPGDDEELTVTSEDREDIGGLARPGGEGGEATAQADRGK